MNLAVAFTEYQLLQIQAIVRHYQLHDLSLIVLDNNRIHSLLIDHELFNEIVVLPIIAEERWKRIFKSYIENYIEILQKYIGNEEINILIGAQDENTLFSLIKLLASPKSYWNIEDGIANYYDRDLKFKAGILIKNQVFKIIYRYDLKIQYKHGLEDADRIFRMAPEISNEKYNTMELSPILKTYLFNKAKEIFKNQNLIMISMNDWW